MAIAIATVAFSGLAFADRELPTFGIMRFEASDDIEASLADFCTEALAQELALTGRFRVMDWRRMERAIKAAKDETPNMSQEDAADQAIEDLGLDGVCRGSIRTVGSSTIVRVWKTDQSGAIVKAAQARVSDPDEIEEAIRKVAETIAGEAPAGAATADEPPPDVPPTPEDKSSMTLMPPDGPSGVTDQLRFVHNRLSSEIVNSDRYTMVSWSGVERAMEREREADPDLRRSESREEALLGLGVDRIVELSMSRIGNNYHITAKIMDPDLSVRRIAEETADSEGKLDEAVKELALKIVLPPEEYEEILEERRKKEREDAQRQRERQQQQRARQQEQQEARQTFKNSIGMEFRLISSGQFIMGSNEGERDERPIRAVNITRDFYMGKHPVTQEQFEAVMRTNPSYFSGPNRPVERVSWHDIQEFIMRLNMKCNQADYRLPTEAEWEYAARAGSQTRYPWGDEFDGTYAWYSGNSDSTKDVGTREPNPWGLYDMHGNVWEWVQDWYRDSYDGSPTRNPTGPGSGRARVLRGGSWVNNPEFLRSARRRASNPNFRHAVIGFRLIAEK